MNLQKTLCLLACWILLFSGLQAQDILLRSGDKSKTFKAGTFIKILQPAPGTVPCEKCSHNILGGKLISYQQGIVTMTVHEKKEVLMTDGKILGFRETSYVDDMPLVNLDIPKSDILSIAQSGKKKLKSQTTGSTIATILAVLGVGHLASIPLADENAGLLAVVGASELVLATILGVSSTPRTYITHMNCPDKPKNTSEIWNWE